MEKTEEIKEKVEVIYSEQEIAYRSELVGKLLRSHNIEEETRDEYDGMNRSEYYEDNERRANIYLPPRKNREDTIISTGVTNQKLFAFATAINNLNLTADITAFDTENRIIANLGETMEAIIRKSEELELDEEKKLLRIVELLKHGEVFVEDVCIKQTEVKKRINNKFNGKISSAKWSERVVALRPKLVRNIISGLNVYLGDVTIWGIQNQPYIFTRRIISYPEAESIYGKWERFKYVSKTREDFVKEVEAMTSYQKNWSLSELQNGQVEEIKFQDKWKNEYMVLLNGVMMLPIRFPLPWEYNLYNIEQQILQPINPFFAHGKSLPSKFKTLDSVLDEMLKLMVLKTQRSLLPAISNMTGRVLSPRVFMPGKINNGIDSSLIKPMLADLQGVNNTEYQMFERIQKMVDDNSITPQFQGQESSSPGTTATEVLNKQRQAEIMLGNTIFASSLLEKKLANLRIPNILQNWLDPVDTKIDEVRKTLISVYNNISVPGQVPNKGMGENIVQFFDETIETPTPEQIYEEENEIENRIGVPVKKYVINAKKLKNLHESAKLNWRITVVPKPKQSSELEQIMFRNMLVDLSMFQQDLNIPELEAEAARVWNKNPAKLFKPQSPETMARNVIMPQQQSGGISELSKKVGEMSATGGVSGPSSIPTSGIGNR